MTKAELRAEVFRRLEAAESTSVFWSADDVDAAIDEAYDEISDAAEWCEVWRTIDLCAQRPYYDMRTVFADVDVLTPGAAFHENTNRWLVPASAADLDRGYPRWEQVIGPPERIVTRGLWWLGYWPITGSESGTVKQYATALPEALEDDDEPGFADRYHLALVEYALSILWPQAGEVSRALESWQTYAALEGALSADVQGRGAVPRRHGLGD